MLSNHLSRTRKNKMKILTIATLLALSGCGYQRMALECAKRGGAIIQIEANHVCAKVEVIDTDAPIPAKSGKQ